MNSVLKLYALLAVLAYVGWAGSAEAATFEALSVGTSFQQVDPGDKITVSRSIKNSGWFSATCEYRLYLSKDKTITTSDKLIYDATSSSIAKNGGVNSGNISATIPSSTAPGFYYVGLLIDDLEAGNPDRVATSSANVAVNKELSPGNTLYESESLPIRANPGSYSSRWNIIGTSSTGNWGCSMDGASSAFSSNQCDFVVADGNAASGVQSAEGFATQFGSKSASIQYQRGWSATSFTWGSNDVIRGITFDVPSSARGNYYIDIDMKGNGSDFRWFVYSPRSNAKWVSSHVADNGPYSANNSTFVDCDESGTWLLVIARDGGNKGSSISGCSVDIDFYEAEFEATSVSGNGSIYAGEKLNVTRKIENVGLATDKCSYEIYLSTDSNITQSDIRIKNDATSNISGGYSDTDTVSCSTPSSIAPGNYYIGLYIDDKYAGSPYRIASYSRSITIKAPPAEFSANSISASGVVEQGKTISVTREIINLGGTGGKCDYEILLSQDRYYDSHDHVIFSDTSPTISGGAGKDSRSVSATISTSIPVGHYYVLLRIIDPNAVSPFEEVTASASVQVTQATTPVPVFQADSVDATGNYASDDPISVWRSIKNTGTKTDDCNYQLYLSSDDIIDMSDILLKSYSVNVASMGGMSSTTVEGIIPANTPTGSYYVGLYITDADRGTIYAKASPSASVYVTKPVDPTPVFNAQSASGGGSFDAGDMITVNSTIRNDGGLGGDCDYTLFLSTDHYFDGSDPQLGVEMVTISAFGSRNPSDNTTIPSNTPAGSYYLGLKITGAYAGTQSLVFSGSPIVVLTDPKPDHISFIAKSVSAVGPVKPGHSLSVKVEIENTGSTADFCDFKLHLSQDRFLGAGDISLGSRKISVAPGSPDRVPTLARIPNSVVIGEYYLILEIVDTDRGSPFSVSSSETVEVKSHGTARFNAISFTYSSDLLANSRLMVDVKLENTGDDEGQCKIGLFLSDDKNWDGLDTPIGEFDTLVIGANEKYDREHEIILVAPIETGKQYLLLKVLSTSGFQGELSSQDKLVDNTKAIQNPAPSSSGGGGGGSGCAINGSDNSWAWVLALFALLALSARKTRKESAIK